MMMAVGQIKRPKKRNFEARALDSRQPESLPRNNGSRHAKTCPTTIGQIQCEAVHHSTRRVSQVNG
ncbi:hypothetical protein RBSWK_04508 [Rhodopirellula baltica SWK14]|uniref:Uncharacterized protein n=2 Tax=Rhodopirellula baltica TaxID=265606 RepID=L7CD86_RHOBT|nr:hypothetical protein RBSWK_04508 [Rhodopirellula baltica SWK14]